MDRHNQDYNITGAVLAGGRAMRMGGLAKGALQICNGVSIIEHLINQLHIAGITDVIIVANDSVPYQNLGIEIIPDIREGLGPVGGIEAALGHFAGQSDAVLFVPCDTPNITAKEISALKKAFIETEKPVVFAQTTGFFWHPLCAVVHNGLKEQISAAVDNGNLKIRDFWRQIDAKAVQFPDSAAFLNINDSADMEKWRKAENEKTYLC